MADIVIKAENISRTGLNVIDQLTTVDIANSYLFVNSGNTRLYVKNSTASLATITIETVIEVDELSVTDQSGTIAVGKDALFGPFPVKWYNDNQGRVTITANQAVEILAIKG